MHISCDFFNSNKVPDKLTNLFVSRFYFGFLLLASNRIITDEDGSMEGVF